MLLAELQILPKGQEGEEGLILPRPSKQDKALLFWLKVRVKVGKALNQHNLIPIWQLFFFYLPFPLFCSFFFLVLDIVLHLSWQQD